MGLLINRSFWYGSRNFYSQEATRLQPKMVGTCAIGEMQRLKKRVEKVSQMPTGGVKLVDAENTTRVT